MVDNYWRWLITWYTFRVDEEGDPADDDKEAGGEEVGDHVEGHLSRQNQLKTSNAVQKVSYIIQGSLLKYSF